MIQSSILFLWSSFLFRNHIHHSICIFVWSVYKFFMPFLGGHLSNCDLMKKICFFSFCVIAPSVQCSTPDFEFILLQASSGENIVSKKFHLNSMWFNIPKKTIFIWKAILCQKRFQKKRNELEIEEFCYHRNEIKFHSKLVNDICIIQPFEHFKLLRKERKIKSQFVLVKTRRSQNFYFLKLCAK